MRMPLIATLALGIALVGCPGRNQLAGISDSTYVSVMARLHRIETDDRLSREERDSMRVVVLNEEALTPEQLEAAARVLAQDPQRAQDVWLAIERKSAEPVTAPETPVRPARPVPQAPAGDTGARRRSVLPSDTQPSPGSGGRPRPG